MGKFKSYHNVGDNLAQLMTKTFFAMLTLSDTSGTLSRKIKSAKKKEQEEEEEQPASIKHKTQASLHYNIQIHLPATKDADVYNAIFKSLKEHILAE